MKYRLISVAVAVATLGLAIANAADAPAAARAPADFTGDWQRYNGSRGWHPGRPGDLTATGRQDAAATKVPGTLRCQAREGARIGLPDAKGEPIAASGVDCLPYGMPEMMSAIYPLEILQTPGQVTVVAEAFSQVRRIYLGKTQPKIEDVPPGYYGHSVGHWEGKTLVVDTVGVKESVLGHSEMPHSDRMRITERLQLVTPDILHDQITVEDPVTLAQPWTFTFAYKRMQNYEMLEYICENNHEYIDDQGVTHLRLQDK